MRGRTVLAAWSCADKYAVLQQCNCFRRHLQLCGATAIYDAVDEHACINKLLYR